MVYYGFPGNAVVQVSLFRPNKFFCLILEIYILYNLTSTTSLSYIWLNGEYLDNEMTKIKRLFFSLQRILKRPILCISCRSAAFSKTYFEVFEGKTWIIHKNVFFISAVHLASPRLSYTVSGFGFINTRFLIAFIYIVTCARWISCPYVINIIGGILKLFDRFLAW